jgi:hypothetical protein
MLLLQYWHCFFFFKMAASHSTMFDILVKVGLGEHYGVFLEQKVTPDIGVNLHCELVISI